MTATVGSAAVVVGAHHVSQSFPVEEILTQAGVVLPAGVSGSGYLAAELLSPPVPAATLSSITWTVTDPVEAADLVHADLLVTAITDEGVERSVHLVDESGRVREHGTQVWELGTPGSTRSSATVDFCSVGWGQLVAGRLSEDSAFASSLATWDGTIGLRCGEREVHLRVYRGDVIDVTRRVPHGATFTFIASPRLWTELALDPDDNFMRRAIAGEFSSSGDGYEYLRLTKPLGILMAHVRDIAQETRP